ncbi:hypothetical protein [Streptomyces europaeiscabiei]|uniref:hypothetical protein n=1 Tax=Streptomyces europaeiscabiei TaxID=146819 RepID=UPI002E27391D|nr:hypothetical protein OG858_37020 [Streptomyces europaeiscabiei]
MSLASTLTPPPVVDIQLEILRLRNGDWQVDRNDDPLPVGEHVAVRCVNRGDEDVFAVLLVRDMAGELRATNVDLQELPPGKPVPLGTTSGFTVAHGDVALVVAVSADPAALESLTERPWDETVEVEGWTPLSLPVEVQLGESNPSDNEVSGLLSLAIHGTAVLNRMALQALTLLPLRETTSDSLTAFLDNALRLVDELDRPFQIQVAANFGSSRIREHLRGIALDGTDPHQDIALHALGEVGDSDESIIEMLQAMLDGKPSDRRFAAQCLAFQEKEPSEFPFKVNEEDPAAFWIAVGSARYNNYEALHDLIVEADSVAFYRVVGDPDNSYYALRNMGKLPDAIRVQLEKDLDRRPAQAVNRFLKEMLREGSKDHQRSLTDGVRHIPEVLAEKIRNELRKRDWLVDLSSFSGPQARGWKALESLNNAERGVLLSELLLRAAELTNQAAAVNTTTRLVARWANYAWYPDLGGLLCAARRAVDIGNIWSSRKIARQVAWAASRAPISPLLRSINERLLRGSLKASDLDVLIGGIVTHFDDIPRPQSVLIQRLPRCYQSKPSETQGPIPLWRARAWVHSLTNDKDKGALRILFSIEPSDDRLSAAPQDVVVALQAEGAEVIPAAAQAVFPFEGSSRQPLAFELLLDKENLDLRFLVHSKNTGVLLQELQGSVDVRRVRK